MRTINAALTTAQKSLSSKPTITVTIDGNDVSAYVLEYHYDEPGDVTLVLNNAAGTFNSPPAYICEGKTVVITRGLTVSGTVYSNALPTCWIEEYFYDFSRSKATLSITCVDWWGKLNRWHATEDKTWTAEDAQTICEWILTQVNLTLMTGSLTSLTLDFTINQGESGTTAMNRLMDFLPEYLYAGIAGEVKFKALDAKAVDYTFGWNAEHPVLTGEGGHTAWEYNTVEYLGTSGKSGEASDAAQVALVGTRKLTVEDEALTSDADCAQAAAAELTFYEAEADEMTIVCRPCHGLEQFDMLKFDNPPWGAADITARVVRIAEDYNRGTIHQTISCGKAHDKPGGHLAIEKATAPASPSKDNLALMWKKIHAYLKRIPLKTGSIKRLINDLIGVHAAKSNAHHARYTDAEALAAFITGNANFKVWAQSDLDDNVITLLQAGSIVLGFHYWTFATNGTTRQSTSQYANSDPPASFTPYYDGITALTCSYNEDGSMTLQRTAGTDPIDILIAIMWF